MQNHPIINKISTDCTACKKCVTGCAFLTEYGHPAQLAADFRTGKMLPETPYQCSQCGLCESICPEKLNLTTFFQALREASYIKQPSVIKKAKRLLRYESIGNSGLFSYFHMPEGSSTVFFPGCTLPAMRPETVFTTYQKLDHIMKGCGIALSCCNRPSHILGRKDKFEKQTEKMLRKFEEMGVKQLVTACPNCYITFRDMERSFSVISVYEVMDGKLPRPFRPRSKNVPMLHDPCPQRFAPQVQEAIRNLLDQQKLPYNEAATPRHLSRCCGEGGAVPFFRPEFAENWRENRLADIRVSGGGEAITSCAGCINRLKQNTPDGEESTAVTHVLDLILTTGAKPLPADKEGLSRYTGRLSLKKKFKKFFQERLEK